MATPMYVLIVDLSSLVIRPPFIRSPINVIESETGHLRHFFFQTKGDIYHGPPPSISPAEDIASRALKG
jgi:hypothetical protein